ncbi:MAG: hypothetical protein CM15mP22_5630 [Gammaproteobacteria bacterium]|nr:MAG: hypothetical protein CM15mP22_5630 [Gammaproteobacteria bacterium]
MYWLSGKDGVYIKYTAVVADYFNIKMSELLSKEETDL